MHAGPWWDYLRETDDLETPRLRWESNIKMTQNKWGGVVDWIDLVQEVQVVGFMNMLMKFRSP
jgi:hypothetical protein